MNVQNFRNMKSIRKNSEGYTLVKNRKIFNQFKQIFNKFLTLVINKYTVELVYFLIFILRIFHIGREIHLD